MITPYVDATSTQWVRPLVQSNFELEYKKGCNNTVVDILSWVTTQLDPDMVKAILSGVAMGSVQWGKVHDPTVVEGDHLLEQEVCVMTGCALVQMHVTDWAQNPAEGSNVMCSFRLAESTEEDIFEGTSGPTCLQWRRLTDLTEMAEFHHSSGSSMSALNAQGWNWGPSTLHSPYGPSCHCLEWVP